MLVDRADEHPFVERPHRTTLVLTLPVMGSLIVEPLAGVVDTAFVERLGAAPAASLGAATALLSSFLWLFNFLGIGTQTEIAHALGQGGGRRRQVSEAATLGVGMALGLGAALALLAWNGLGAAAAWMSEDHSVREATRAYLEIRLLGAPAGLVAVAAFGVLRGLQDMRTPLWVAAGMSGLNVVLDPVLIFGAGPIPALGIAGAAWATAGSQVVGAVWAVRAVSRRAGFATRFEWRRAWRLMVIGRDMVARTGALLLFLLLSTRAALQAGVDAGAAHQALRQVWTLLAFLLDAFAATAQSLVGYFVGAGRRDLARRVAVVTSLWALAAGVVVALALGAAKDAVAFLLVPPSAQALFGTAWWLCVSTQPLNALSFVTDGIHWGTGDYRYLRNAMWVSTGAGIAALFAIDMQGSNALALVWAVTAVWISLRCVFGLLRVWPGIGNAPLSRLRAFGRT